MEVKTKKQTKKPRQILMDFVRCAGTTKSGQRCPFRAKVRGRCGHHPLKIVGATNEYLADSTGKRRYWELA